MAKKPSLAAKAREAGMPYGTVHHRVKKLGWSEKRALTTPVRRRATPGQVEDATFEPSPTPAPSAENTTTLQNTIGELSSALTEQRKRCKTVGFIGVVVIACILAWATST
jgi:hypothetical protein